MIKRLMMNDKEKIKKITDIINDNPKGYYSMNAFCGNCGNSFEVSIPKGTKKENANVECENCGVKESVSISKPWPRSDRMFPPYRVVPWTPYYNDNYWYTWNTTTTFYDVPPKQNVGKSQ